jgi:hypothetical protein
VRTIRRAAQRGGIELGERGVPADNIAAHVHKPTASLQIHGNHLLRRHLSPQQLRAAVALLDAPGIKPWAKRRDNNAKARLLLIYSFFHSLR